MGKQIKNTIRFNLYYFLAIALSVTFQVPKHYFSQTNLDSLLSVYQNRSLKDTVRYVALKTYVWNIKETNIQKADIYADTLLELANKKNILNWQGTILNFKGVIAVYQSKHIEAIELFFQSMEKHKKDNNYYAVADILSNIGVIHNELLNTQKARDCFLESINIFDSIDQHKRTYLPLSNLAISYEELNEWDKAKECYIDLFKMDQEKASKAIILSNYGEWFYKKYTKSETFKDFSLLDSALHYQTVSFDLMDSLNMQNSYYYLLPMYRSGLVLLEQNKNEKAKPYLDNALELATTFDAEIIISECMRSISKYYEKTNNFKEAIHWSEEYEIVQQILYNEENTKSIAAFEYNLKGDLELEKTKDQDEAKILLLNLKNNLEIKSNQNENYRRVIIISLTSVVLLILIGIIKKLVQKLQLNVQQRKNIQYQSENIEQANKLIESNILAAKKIQKNVFKDSLNFLKKLNISLLFLPKEAVGGDFYFAKEITQQKSLIALCDCTGHGVAGGLTTLLMKQLIEESINESNAYNLEEIIYKLNDKLFIFLNKVNELKTGMECGFIIIDSSQKEISFFGTKTNLQLQTKKGSITEIKGIRKSLGEQPTEKLKEVISENIFFTTFNSVKRLYISSDGFYDQKGGIDEEKYMRQRFRSKLNQLSEIGWEKIELELKKEFLNWKGNLEQIDDVSVLGIDLDKI